LNGYEDAVLSCRGVSKSFGSVAALESFDLELRAGSLMALLGPSGCGKTTALRIMAGFERPDAGEVWVAERRVAARCAWVAPEHRRIGMVFQDWALFPHLDVWHNVAFGLPKEHGERVREVLELVRLAGYDRRMPHELSGGQQQRVALARALAPSPQLILLDEPFSNLDASLRASVRAEVRAVLRAAKATAIFVTHDQEEALSIADELAVMCAGRILQVGAPHDVYRAPLSRQVAGLVGEANFLPGRVARERVSTPLGTMPARGVGDGAVQVMIRPETIHLEAGCIDDAVIVDTEFYGHDQVVRARLADGTAIDVRLLGPRPDLAIGSQVRVTLTEPPHFYPAPSGSSIRL